MNAISLDTTRPISIAVLAMGGQGGGVLVDWIVALAEDNGYAAQSTSVPGVAQRTGATIYYVEIIPAPPDGLGLSPVLSLMPVPGEVDIVVGAELMEAGRAMLRGLVSPDRTTLIASSHRSYAVQEKIAPGDGLADPAKVYVAAAEAAKRFLAFDMAEVAERTGSAVSAVLFGALAGSGALPFARTSYEATIRAAGIGVEGSLRAFGAGYERAVADLASGATPEPPPGPDLAKLPPSLAAAQTSLQALAARAEALPTAAQPMAAAGLQSVVDFQDTEYGSDYLDLVDEFCALDRAHGGERKGFVLTIEAAKYIAKAMAYDDVIRVADLKTRASRFERVRREVAAKPDQIVYATEFMHPRLEEICGTLPERVGRFIETSPGLTRVLKPALERGRRVRTGTVLWFLTLYALACMRRFRRGTLRHARERAHLSRWLNAVRATVTSDYDLAVEMLRNRRLIKGYSDTYARGESKFDRVSGMAERLKGRPDAAEWVARLRKAALADEEGRALDDTIRTVETFL